MAPEIVNRTPYDGKKTDVWALGVLVFKMLTGNFPFRAATEPELYQKIKSGIVKYPSSISPELRDLLQRIFVIAPEDRISADLITRHSWFCFDVSKATITTFCNQDERSTLVPFPSIA